VHLSKLEIDFDEILPSGREFYRAVESSPKTNNHLILAATGFRIRIHSLIQCSSNLGSASYTQPLYSVCFVRQAASSRRRFVLSERWFSRYTVYLRCRYSLFNCSLQQRDDIFYKYP